MQPGVKKNKSYWYYEQQLLGFNYRMNEFSAAIILAQLERISFFLKLRRRASNELLKVINKSKILKPQKVAKKN